MVLGSDGRVAEQGSYKELSSRRDGVFTKLMEWQLSGGETWIVSPPRGGPARGPPSAKEQLQQLLREEYEEYEDMEDDEEQETVDVDATLRTAPKVEQRQP